jgi:hypothetical protein
MKLSFGEFMFNNYLDRNAITLARLNGFKGPRTHQFPI